MFFERPRAWGLTWPGSSIQERLAAPTLDYDRPTYIPPRDAIAEAFADGFVFNKSQFLDGISEADGRRHRFSRLAIFADRRILIDEFSAEGHASFDTGGDVPRREAVQARAISKSGDIAAQIVRHNAEHPEKFLGYLAIWKDIEPATELIADAKAGAIVALKPLEPEVPPNDDQRDPSSIAS